MAVAHRRTTVVNSGRKKKNAGRRRKLSPAQIAAGFGGKRRQSAQKSHRRRSKPAMKANKAHKSRSSHRRRSAPKRTKPNLGKVISFSLPKEFNQVAKTKSNRGTKRHYSSHRKTKANRGHRRSTRRNAGLGGMTDHIQSAVFTIAGAVGSKYLTQMVLTTSNTGVMGYIGNLVSAFVLSWGVKAFMKNEKAAAAVLSGGFVQIVLRLIADYTPFGQYTANLGMGDYLAQNWLVPQRIAYKPHQATLMAPGAGMGSCGGLYTPSRSLYAA